MSLLLSEVTREQADLRLARCRPRLTEPLDEYLFTGRTTAFVLEPESECGLMVNRDACIPLSCGRLLADIDFLGPCSFIEDTVCISPIESGLGVCTVHLCMQWDGQTQS